MLTTNICSALAGRPEKEGDPIIEPEGAIEVLLNPGDAFIVNRRLRHSRSINTSERIRKLMFIGYTYRWTRPSTRPSPTSPPTGSRARPRCSSSSSATAPTTRPSGASSGNGWIDDEIPLRAELVERGLLDRDAPFLR